MRKLIHVRADLIMGGKRAVSNVEHRETRGESRACPLDAGAHVLAWLFFLPIARECAYFIDKEEESINKGYACNCMHFVSFAMFFSLQ